MAPSIPPCSRAQLPRSALSTRTSATIGGRRVHSPPRASAAHYQGLDGFSDGNLDEFNLAVMGDLHLEPEGMEPFLEAREHLRAAMSGHGARVLQLGDLGGYSAAPGSRECFARAKRFLSGFGVPVALVTGNHDLEGAEFETDEENLAAWSQAFGQRHYWAADLGPALLVGLSTTRFRSNRHSVHEVHVDAQQLEFLEAQLVAAGGRPVVLATHAPAMGCGLRVVQRVHVKNRCAWVNHSSDPGALMRLVEAHPNIRLWFSGHFHLSHNYPDSISVVGGTAFVQVGVIGECNRDGFRQSRLLRGTRNGFELYSVDHGAGGALRLDLAHAWADPSAPAVLTPRDEMICDPGAGWLCSRVDCGLDAGGAPAPSAVQWFNAGGDVMLALQDDTLVEYDARSLSPVGVVLMDVAPEAGGRVALVDAAGDEVDATGTDGSQAAAVELRSGVDGSLLHRVLRNEDGGFYQIFQANKWRARKEKEAREAAERARLAGGQRPVAA